MYLEAYDRDPVQAGSVVSSVPVMQPEVVSQVVSEPVSGAETYAYSDVVTVPQVMPQVAVAAETAMPEYSSAMPAGYIEIPPTGEIYQQAAVSEQMQPSMYEAPAAMEMASYSEADMMPAEAENPMAGVVEVPANFVVMDKAEAGYYMQAGAFSSRENASRFAKTLQESALNPVVIVEDETSGRMLYKPQVGPFASVAQALSVEAKLNELGVAKPSLHKR